MIGGDLQGVLTFALASFAFVVLGLLEIKPLRRRLHRVADLQLGAEAIGAAAEIAARLQICMQVRFGMSALTGLGFWTFAAVLHREWASLRLSSASYRLSARSSPPSSQPFFVAAQFETR